MWVMLLSMFGVGYMMSELNHEPVRYVMGVEGYNITSVVTPLSDGDVMREFNATSMSIDDARVVLYDIDRSNDAM